MLVLLVLELRFFQRNQPAYLTGKISIIKDLIVSSIITKWTGHSDN